ncbi:hypothetical protein Pmani_030246 [Petrolisthes manimaculis]|uniref:Uncharacterized protein n=1 Tax=Petrolisthes manimaculis TaxID=1843537 RepID=A0AAE1NYD9_9EUCA|nr:hypothetical protein Pmani_030246 [Petrolisthes manimaculis]
MLTTFSSTLMIIKEAVRLSFGPSPRYYIKQTYKISGNKDCDLIPSERGGEAAGGRWCLGGGGGERDRVVREGGVGGIGTWQSPVPSLSLPQQECRQISTPRWCWMLPMTIVVLQYILHSLQLHQRGLTWFVSGKEGSGSRGQCEGYRTRRLTQPLHISYPSSQPGNIAR